MISTRYQKKMEYVDSFKTALEKNSSIYLSMHGAPSHRYIDESLYGKADEDTIHQFITENYCQIPENIILITTTTTNLTLATDKDDEDKFKKLFSTPYWGLDECSICKDGKHIPYQIYKPGDIVYNQDLSFDAIEDPTFDIYVKKDDDFELYKEQDIPYYNGKTTNNQKGSLIKKNILLKNIPPPMDSGIKRDTIHRITDKTSGFLNKPETPAITTSINLLGFFNLIKDVYPDIKSKDSEYLVVYAPYCNPTWPVTDSEIGLCLNYLNDVLRSRIEGYGLSQFKEFKRILKGLSENDRDNLKKSQELCEFIKSKPLISPDYDEQDSWLLPEENSLQEYREAGRESMKLVQTEKVELIHIYPFIESYINGPNDLIQTNLRNVILNNIKKRRDIISNRAEHQQPAYWGGNKNKSKNKKTQKTTNRTKNKTTKRKNKLFKRKKSIKKA